MEVDLSQYEAQYVLRMRKLLEILEKTDQPVLDIGPGYYGLLEQMLSPQGRWRLVVVDINIDALRNIDKSCDRIVAAAEALPFRDGSLPTVTSQSTFQVMCDQKAFLDELSRVLRLDGFYAVTIEYGANYDEGKQTFPARKPGYLVDYLVNKGLKVTELKHLAYSGDWVKKYEEAFSLWITGGKASPPPPEQIIRIGSKVNIVEERYTDGVVIDLAGWNWKGGHERRKMVNVRYKSRGRWAQGWFPRDLVAIRRKKAKA